MQRLKPIGRFAALPERDYAAVNGVVCSFQLAHFSSGNIFKLFPALSGQVCRHLSRDFVIPRESPFLVCLHDVLGT